VEETEVAGALTCSKRPTNFITWQLYRVHLATRGNQTDKPYLEFISNLDSFPSISLSDIVSINLRDSDTGKYWSPWRHMMFNTDKNNSVRFESLDIHYHSLSFQPSCNTSDNACLDLQNWCYSIYISIIHNITKVFNATTTWPPLSWRKELCLSYMYRATVLFSE
jgi:hypothetical protein